MQTYTIREISRLFSLPLSTLRYYEEEGLLTNVQKSASGQRIYTQEHIDRLHCINCFKRTGMTLAQLKKLFEYETDEVAHIDDIIALLEEQEMQVNEKLTQLQKDSRHVHHKIAHYRRSASHCRPACQCLCGKNVRRTGLTAHLMDSRYARAAVSRIFRGIRKYINCSSHL